MCVLVIAIITRTFVLDRDIWSAIGSNMTAEEKLNKLGFPLPPPPAAVAAYVPWVRTGNLILTSGQLPWRNGEIAFKGRLGAELTEEQGRDAARFCALNALAQLKQAAGDLERIRILKIDGYVHSAPGFRAQPKVLNGASELINEVFGDRGKHARLALGISEMPLDAAVQISMTAEYF
jgi:enamine deaminase RidA (YjgF/YER057c/UK114 family)